MPTAINDDDRFRITSFCYLNGQVGVNSQLWRMTTVGAVTIYPQEVADQLSPLFASFHKAYMPASARYLGCQVRRVTGLLPFDRTVTSQIGAGAGTGFGNPLPSQVAVVVQLHTTLLGRKYQGRLYLPFPYVGMTNLQGEVDAATNGLISNDAFTLYCQGQLINGTVGNGTISAGRNEEPSNTFHPYTEASADTAWGTQKRRGLFGQLNRLPF
jgi:hypothetical protein